MRIIFCCESDDIKLVDNVYSQEADVAISAGFKLDLIDFEALVDDEDPDRAVRKIKCGENDCSAIYRGWMLTVEQYTQLYNTLLKKGVNLINSPEQYKTAHHMPENYKFIENYTPKTVWVPYKSPMKTEEIEKALSVFNGKPIIVKDYVKSQKHYWKEACYIPDSGDSNAVDRVISKFLELQDYDIQGGLVFREFAELEPIGLHSQSGMPLTLEFRLFVLDGNVFSALPYWEEGTYNVFPKMGKFKDVIRSIPSRFYSMDIAKRTDGEWIIVEIGDGQVSALPRHTDISMDIFYSALFDRVFTV